VDPDEEDLPEGALMVLDDLAFVLKPEPAFLLLLIPGFVLKLFLLTFIWVLTLLELLAVLL
jgi:hypothetical protein